MFSDSGSLQSFSKLSQLCGSCDVTGDLMSSSNKDYSLQPLLWRVQVSLFLREPFPCLLTIALDLHKNRCDEYMEMHRLQADCQRHKGVI